VPTCSSAARCSVVFISMWHLLLVLFAPAFADATVYAIQLQSMLRGAVYMLSLGCLAVAITPECISSAKIMLTHIAGLLLCV
jgi:hypothetical protein